MIQSSVSSMKQSKTPLETGKPLEIDCAQVIKAEEYEIPPFIKGHTEVDGNAVAQAVAQEEPEIEEIDFDSEF